MSVRIFKAWGLGIFGVKVLAARGRQVEVDPGILSYPPVLLGTGILDAVEGLPEHGVVGFFSVKQEIDGIPHPFVVYLGSPSHQGAVSQLGLEIQYPEES